MKFLRFLFAWRVLFGSKFMILEAITLAFGDKVRFGGIYRGIVTLIVVIVVILVIVAMPVAQEAIVRLWGRLGDRNG